MVPYITTALSDLAEVVQTHEDIQDNIRSGAPSYRGYYMFLIFDHLITGDSSARLDPVALLEFYMKKAP
jgi:hypothetical protein